MLLDRPSISRPFASRRIGGFAANRLSRTLAAGLGLALGAGFAPRGVATAFGQASGAKEKQPVYVGARACAACHEGPAAGHQYSLWRASAHAKAYAALWSPEAKEIARLSGIPEEPQRSPLCLGCHATAETAEAWEKEDSFRMEDGVQCEKCHGPGSEYMPDEIMRDRKKAMERGLRMPTDRDCMMCHAEKGSHVAVLKTPLLALEPAKAAVAHPIPRGEAAARAAEVAAKTKGLPSASPKSAFRYAGVWNCAACHDGPSMGYQFSRWRVSRHARAYAVLATPKGYEVARSQGVEGNPQKAEACLKCHSTGFGLAAESFLEGFDPREGVTCEACHGPGEKYSAEAAMRDRRLAAQLGLKPVTRETCVACHDDSSAKPFDYEANAAKIAHPTKTPEHATAGAYKTPLNLAVSPDGRELYVACEASHTVGVVDVASRKVVAEIPVGRQPTEIAFHPDGRRAYVTNRLDDTLSVIDTRTRSAVATVAVGDEPHGVAVDTRGERVYVLNTLSDDISVIDTATLSEVRRLPASRRPWSFALSPDGKTLLATNALPRFGALRESPRSEVTAIDAERAVVGDRIVVPDANLLLGADWHPSGEFALVTLCRTKNLVPMTRLLQGWTITNGLGILWKDGTVDQVLLDEPSLCFPDPTDVACSPDGRYALVTSSGSDRVAVVDVEKLAALIRRSTPEERERVLPNHLGKPTEFVVAHVPVKNSPRGVVFAKDGSAAFVANCLDDSVSVIDMARLENAGRIDLGGPREITKGRFGERLFHSANVTFQRQFSCHTCHPDGHVNGLTFDIEPDGIGVSPVDNRTLRGILDTAPFKWEGTNPTISRECGPRLAVFFTRIQPFAPEEIAAVDYYISTIQRPPNRFRPLGAELTPAQRRGKAVFERTHKNDGTPIPEGNRCVTCHFPPLYTDRRRHDVGTQFPFDRESRFDSAHLTNIYDSAPYLHNGIAPTLEEIWTRYNPHDKHGVTNDMTKDQLNDLIEFLKTL